MLSWGTEAEAQTDRGRIHSILSQGLSFLTCKLGHADAHPWGIYGKKGSSLDSPGG